MENSPKKSKALIITIIIIIFLLVIGFLVYKNRDNFGGKTSGFISKIFSPLSPSKNPKDLKTTLAQAGEDLRAGDDLSLSGYDENNNPIVTKAGNNSNVYGFANQDILSGELGQISIYDNGTNGFWNSFSNFLNDLFGVNNYQNNMPPGGWNFNSNLGIWEFDPNGLGGWIIDPNGGGWIPPGGSGEYNPQCSDTSDNDTDGAIDANDPNCHVGGTMDGEYLPNHYSESSNPFGGDSECENGATNPPLCNTFEEIYACSDEVDNDGDTLIDNLDPTCHRSGDINSAYIPTHDSEADAPCENGASNPPLCTIFEKEKIPDLTARRVTPPTALINIPTPLSATIANIGTGSTAFDFPTLFTITNRDVGVNTDIEGEVISSQSKIKKFVLRIIKKIPWVSKATAETTSNEEVDINVELSVMVPTLLQNSTRVATVSYTFTTPGIFYIRACADKESIGNRGVIAETDEENNCGPWTTFEATSSIPPPGELPKCSDGIDNDRDTLIDNLDPACHIDGNLENEYIPGHNSESIAPGAVYECSDNQDNDNDAKIDNDDPQCHLDGDLEKDYVAEHNSELDAPSSGDDGGEENLCLYIEQNPLEFTSEEKARLAILLRKFYLISSSLRTEDDISTIYNEIDQQKNFMSGVDDLTKQCYLQTNDKDDFLDFCYRNKSLCNTNALGNYDETIATNEFNDEANRNYTGLRQKVRKGNPYFAKESGGTFPYTDEAETETAYFDVNWLEGNYYYDANGNWQSLRSGIIDPHDQSNTGPGCKVISGYLYGETANGTDCDDFNTFYKYSSCSDVQGGLTGEGTLYPQSVTTYIQQGCKWKAGFDWEQTEKILKIW